MQADSRITCTVIVLLSVVCRSTSIQCYYCNSANNSACIDINQYDDEIRARIIPIVNCETAIPSAVAANFFCRKIVQTIFHSHRDSEIRVTRGCGWVKHQQRECYRADNSDHLETVCQCFHDHCNKGENVDPASTTGLFLLLATCLYFIR